MWETTSRWLPEKKRVANGALRNSKKESEKAERETEL